jgi:hypothetical protein
MVCGRLPGVRLLRDVVTSAAAVSSAAVVAAAAAFITRAICLDWLRVAASLPGAAVLPSWCVIDKTFQLTWQEQFQEQWCANDVLAHTTVHSVGSLVGHSPNADQSHRHVESFATGKRRLL